MTTKVLRTVVPLLLLFTSHLPAQPAFNPVYADTGIATIQVFINPDSLARIMDPANAQSDHEYPATCVFTNGLIHDTLDNIGFRLRGNTSRTSRKKSFKISVNAFDHGRKFAGLEKLNVNGEHNDPSIVRSKLCWDLFAAAGVTGSRAAHARMFINGHYYGLYINVEHVDENFVLSRFGNNGGNLYKCLYPADLGYLGSNPDLYKLTAGNRRVYELTINEDEDDYADLAHLIAVLNLTPAGTFPVEIQRVFNVNAFLKTLAVDILTGMWDDYWFNKNNYYLYHNTATGRFEFIPYDYDNTFGIWWDGIMPNTDWGTRNVYTWGHPTEPRPLTDRLLAVPLFRNRLSFYLNRLLTRTFVASALFPRIDSLHTMITAAAEADSFRRLDWGYTIQQFHDSYTQPVGDHAPYGLKPYVSTRRNSALGQVSLPDIPPIVSDLYHTPRFPFGGDVVTIRTRIEDEAAPAEARLFVRIDGVEQTPLPLYDDGLHNDGAAGDDVYGATLTDLPDTAIVEYYTGATDIHGQTSLEPPDAPATMQSFRVTGATPRMFINEFMAKNDTTILDPAGEPEDWVEIFNGDTVAISLGNWYLSDNFGNPMKWRFPDTTLLPGTFLLLWADEDGGQGPLHMNFKLSQDGEEIGLYHGNSTTLATVDTITFGPQLPDVSFGRSLDGGGIWQAMGRATPGHSNTITSVKETNPALPATCSLSLPFPNPFNPTVTLTYAVPHQAFVTITIYDLLGREVTRLVHDRLQPGHYNARWNGDAAASGLYFCRLSVEGYSSTVKLLLMK